VANLVLSLNPNLVITTGDNNYGSGAASTIDRNIGQYYQGFIYPYKGAYGTGSTTNRFFPSLGNHDWATAGAAPYLDYFTLPNNERYYAVTRGAVALYAVDSDTHEPDGTSSTSVQANWLKAMLENSLAVWKLVYFHHPPYSSGEHGSSTRMRWPFQAWGAAAILSGHDHDYERLSIRGLPYFVNGVGGRSLYAFKSTIVAGSQVRYNANFGAMLIEATSTTLRFNFYNVDGTLIDSYTKVALATPTKLTAAAVTRSQINLSWTDNSNKEGEYRIYRSTGKRYVQIARVAANLTDYSDTGLAANTKYYYRVRAYSSTSNSATSNAASATTFP
jgi:hypothetical protein